MSEINPTGRYELQAGIPVPKDIDLDDCVRRWPFTIMLIGDCFDEPNPTLFDKCAGAAGLDGFQNNRKYETRLMIRQRQANCPVCDTGWPVGADYALRVWRVA